MENLTVIEKLVVETSRRLVFVKGFFSRYQPTCVEHQSHHFSANVNTPKMKNIFWDGSKLPHAGAM